MRAPHHSDTLQFRNGVWSLWEETQEQRSQLPKVQKYGIEELKVLTRTAVDMHGAFHDEVRDSGVSYFDEHLMGVAEILIQEFGRARLDLIVLALVHDYIEDKATLADLIALMDPVRHGVNVQKLAPNIRGIFESIPEMAKALSKDNLVGKTKQEKQH